MYTYLLSQNNESDDEVLDPDFDKRNNEDRFVCVDMIYFKVFDTEPCQRPF